MAWHDKIKSLRKDEKLTQEELAKKLEVSSLLLSINLTALPVIAMTPHFIAIS